tara:strand:+ start:4443 stop:5258 length:816 start_codon:yes stop_codon:yes gene_type:complete
MFNEVKRDDKMNVRQGKTMDSLTVKPLPTKKHKLPQTEYMKAGIINEYPSMLLLVGKTKSGKSTLCNHLCNEPKFYGGDFFHHIYLFSPTAKKDDLALHLKLDDEHMVTDPTEERLQEIVKTQDDLIESKGIKHCGKNSRVLIIFDDIVGNQKFLKSDTMTNLATMGRHSLISSVINTQSYTKIPRVIRLQANGLIVFPSSNNEIELIIFDLCPPHTSKKQFAKLIEYATTGKHSFLYSNNPEPVETRFRKNFDTYIRCSSSFVSKKKTFY